MSMSRYIVVAAVKCDFDRYSIDGHAIAGGACVNSRQCGEP
jgi:hypothetical protein